MGGLSVIHTALLVLQGLTNRAKPNPCWGGDIQSREARGESDISPIPPISRESSPDGPPLDLGARFGRILLPRVLLFSVMTTFYMTTFQTDHCVFFQIRPPEESPHQKCSPRRGEIDSSTPEVFGDLSVSVFEGRRQTSRICCVNTRNFV